MSSQDSFEILKFIVNRVNVGIVTINQNMEIILWNKFMELNSNRMASEVIGRNIFECFPELPESWLSKKIKSVFVLKNFAFTSWEQRPYLFKFQHNRPVTGGLDYMRQNCTFLPIKNAQGDVEHICITLLDVTDNSLYQTKLQEALQQLKHMSITDALTGIYNRGFFEDTLAKEYNRARRYGGELSLILFDIDHFKNVNDKHGHLAGDEVLRIVAEKSKNLLRSCDIIGRYGGEEFAVILPGVGLEGAYNLSERIRIKIADESISIFNETIQVSVSVGVTEKSQNTSSYEGLIREADAALYFSKENGRNLVSRFRSEWLYL